MGKKNKKSHEQRRQKKIARSKARRKQRICIQGSSVSVKNPCLSKIDYHWWLTHGLNYLNSNYEEGIWDPICDIYAGQTPPEPAELLHRLVTKLNIKDPTKATEKENFLLAWCLGVKNEALYGIIFGLTSILTKENPEMTSEEFRQPYNGGVWAFFDKYVKSKVLG